MKTESGGVLPKGLANMYATDEKRYTGAFSELRFDGLDIEAYALFSVFSGDRKLIARSKTRYHRDIVKYDGSVNNDRSSIWGYRSQIVGDMANAGLIISDEILDSVFKQIEDELVAVHKKVFPEKHIDPEVEKARKSQEAERKAELERDQAKMDKNVATVKAALGISGDKEGRIVFMEGEIETSEQTTVGHFNEPVTIYTLRVGGQIRRIGVRGHCDLLSPGDLIRGEVIDGEVVCRTTHQKYLEVLEGEFQVVENKIEYLKMIGWKMLDSIPSTEGENKDKEKKKES